MGIADSLILAFTIVVGVSTVLYTIITGWLTLETRKTRLTQTEPRISVQVEPDRDGLPGYELVIRNEGQGPAQNIRIDFKGDPSYYRNSFHRNAPPPVDRLPAITDGLDYMAAGRELRFTLGTVSPQESQRAIQQPWRFCVKYENLSGKRRNGHFVVDFSQFLGGVFSPNRLEEISNHLDAMRKDLHRLAEGSARFHVVTQTAVEFRKAREEWRQRQQAEAANVSEVREADDDNK